MPHKITLTGTPKTGLRKIKNESIYAFEMEEKGSDNSPKGLPKSGRISYTVFVSPKQIRKAGLENVSIKNYKLLIQGEPTLDIPKEKCPGEIGVITFKIEILPEKQEAAAAVDTENQNNQVSNETTDRLLPAGTDEYIPIAKIQIPAEFEKKRPSQRKLERVMEYYKETGGLDKPLSVRRDDLMLIDGYTRYIVAKEFCIDTVPVKYV